MKSVRVELPDKLSEELDALILQGWFQNEEEAIRFALLEFLQRNRFNLLEHFHRDDIAWALEQKNTTE